MSRLRRHLGQCFRNSLYLGLSTLLLSGCPRWPGASFSTDVSSSTAEATPKIICDTSSYRAEVITDPAQESLSFVQKPNTNTLTQASPLVLTENSDGSRTYGYQGENTTYARFYSDGTCLVQMVTADGSVMLEEVGTVTSLGSDGSEPVVSSDLDQPDRYQQGYDLGYRDGYQNGEAFRRENRGNTPDMAFPVDTATGNPSYDLGYREGFYDGFAGGYDSFISQEPNVDNLLMSCAGTIDNSIDFTVYYTREAGFNRIDFKPHQSSQTLTANLSYDRKDDQNHGIWRGNVAQMADVVLIHLSTEAPQAGDQVSVGYDNRWGKANCR